MLRKEPLASISFKKELRQCAATGAAPKKYEGFFAESFSQEKIAADDSTVVNIRYKRDTSEFSIAPYKGVYDGRRCLQVRRRR